MHERVGQVLGVTALAVVDRLRAALSAQELGEVAAGALVHVQAWPGGSVGELAGVVGLSQPATVRLVDRLVEQGLLEREQGRDRRTVALVVTDAGSRVADTVLQQRAGVLADLLADLAPSELATLEELLGRIAGGLTHHRPGGIRVCRLCDRGACGSGPGCPLDHVTAMDGPTRPPGSR